METSSQEKFDPRNPSQVENLFRESSGQRFVRQIGKLIRLELLMDVPDAVANYKVHTDKGIFVMRFALEEWRVEKFRLEASILEKFIPKVQLEIPETSLFPAAHGIPAFTIHQWIIGEPLTTEMYLSMSVGCKHQLVDDLTEFLVAVHSIDVQEAEIWEGWSRRNISECDFGKPFWFDQELRERIKALLTGRLQPALASAVINTVEQFEQLSIARIDLAFVHGDIHGFNLAMRLEPHGYELSGVFDFENARVLDIHEDFFRLYFIAQDLVDQTIHAYNQISSRQQPLNYKRINLYWRAFLLYLMMENLEPETLDLFKLYQDMFIKTIKAEK